METKNFAALNETEMQAIDGGINYSLLWLTPIYNYQTSVPLGNKPLNLFAK